MQRLRAIRNSQGPMGPALVVGVQAAIGIEQRILHDIFALEHGPGHARAVSVQLVRLNADTTLRFRLLFLS
jgi:hypothetical protein